MEKVRILIVEDELIIAESLKIMIEAMGYEVPAIFTSGRETLEVFRAGFADIIIMDIKLADNTNGIDTSIEIRKISAAPIIYITDNKDENLRKKAINFTNAAYYITKPFNRHDIATAIDFALKSLKKFELVTKPDNEPYLLNDCLFLKNGLGYKKVMIGDIWFLKADGSYCEFRFKENKVTFSENLSFFEEKLSFSKAFIRIHRSYIVNINCINRVHENRLWIGETEIPIGKTYRNAVNNIVRFI